MTGLEETSVAIAHKDYAVAGGGEIVAERLGLCFDAPVYTGFCNDDNRADLRADVRDLFSGGVSGWLVRRGGVTRQLAYKHLYRRAECLHDYDVVIQSGMEPLWYQPRDRQTTITYVHSTPRLQYDLYPYVADTPDCRRGWLGAFITDLYDDRVRHDFLPHTRYPDHWVANSDLVARRLRRYWNVDADDISIVYPPVPTDELSPSHAAPGRDDFYLSLNRLDDWKRIDEIIDAFRELDATLLIAGKGPAEDELRDQASDDDNIRFLGFVDDAEKRELLASATAVVYNPLNEDFGMVPIEAMASGTPVISVRDGFQRYQIEDGVTGVLYDRELRDRRATVRNLRRAVDRFEADGVAADTAGLQAVAKQFSVDRFNEEMRRVVANVYQATRVTAEMTTAPPAETPAPAVTDGGDDDD